MQVSGDAAAWLAANSEAAALMDEMILRAQETFGDRPQIIIKDVPAGCLYEKPAVRCRMIIRFHNCGINDGIMLRFLEDRWWSDNMHRAGNRLAIRMEFWHGELPPESIAVEARPL